MFKFTRPHSFGGPHLLSRIPPPRQSRISGTSMGNFVLELSCVCQESCVPHIPSASPSPDSPVHRSFYRLILIRPPAAELWFPKSLQNRELVTVVVPGPFKEIQACFSVWKILLYLVQGGV